jgi:hypothetical protein
MYVFTGGWCDYLEAVEDSTDADLVVEECAFRRNNSSSR